MDYVTADLHFGHERIIKFERTQFKSIEEHDEKIIRCLNSALKPGDTLYVLGDVGFRDPLGGLPGLIGKVHRIECAKKILILGNHDKFSQTEARKMGFDEAIKGPYYYPSKEAPGKIILSHRPVREAFGNPYVINVHGHVHGGFLDLPGFHNVNIHMTNYVPKNMRFFEKIAKETLKSREEGFGDEWYFEFETKELEKG